MLKYDLQSKSLHDVRKALNAFIAEYHIHKILCSQNTTFSKKHIDGLQHTALLGTKLQIVNFS